MAGLWVKSQSGSAAALDVAFTANSDDETENI